jgi:Cellulase (glycosyl hydrolase family 5)
MILAAALLPFITVAPDHWTFRYDGGPHQVRSGQHALQVVCEGGSTEVAQELSGLAAGRSVSASVWSRGEGVTVRLLLRFADGQTGQSNEMQAGGRWKKLTVHVQTPPDSTGASLVLQISGTGHASFDDASLSDRIINAGFEEGMRGWMPAREGTGAAWVNGAAFVPWGFNYDRTIYEGKDLVLEEAPIEKIDRDFRAARRIGANSLRLFLQLSRFMPRFMEMHPATLEFLDRVIERARKYDLRLDLTGLSHITGMPEWYDGRSAEEILRAERQFWSAIAKRYAEEPVIFAYDLQNEPVVTGADAGPKAVGCFVMSGKRPFCYVNQHRLDPVAGREETARRWTAAMVEAIREHDRRHLITIGMLPTASPLMGFPNPAFNLRTLAPLLDYVSLHFYPNHPGGDVLQSNQDRLEMLLRYAGQFGKPVVMEEWYPLFPPRSGLHEGDWFPHAIEASKSSATGWFTFYFERLKCGDCKLSEHVGQFDAGAAGMRGMTPKRAPATATMAIDAEKLWRSKEEVERALGEYQALRRSGAVPDFTWEKGR